MQKIKHQLLSCSWLNDNVSLILSLKGCPNEGTAGKEWDPVNLDGDVWEDPEEAGDIEILHSDEFILPKEVTLPPLAVVASSAHSL